MKNRDMYNYIKTLKILESREKVFEFMKEKMNLKVCRYMLIYMYV